MKNNTFYAHKKYTVKGDFDLLMTELINLYLYNTIEIAHMTRKVVSDKVDFTVNRSVSYINFLNDSK